MRFASAVAAFALVLRDSEYRGGASFEQALALARGARGEDENGYRAEFVGMVETARTLRWGPESAASDPARSTRSGAVGHPGGAASCPWPASCLVRARVLLMGPIAHRAPPPKG